MMKLEAGYVLAGTYRLVRPLGKGGEGSVWLALHLRTGQLWAVKVIARQSGGQELHELEMMRQLRHPSLPRIIDVEEDGPWLCLVMEFIPGRSLEAIMEAGGRLSLEQVLDVGIQMGNVLGYLHSRPVPVFHLDVKPANVILKGDGTLVLVDFGSARKAAKEPDEYGRKGTMGFAAPEQFDMDCGVNQQTDLYGLGAMLYYLISGNYYGTDTADRHLAGCPELLAGVIRTCTRVNPEERYSDASQFCQALGKARRRYFGRRRRRCLGIALLLMASAAGLAGRGLAREFSLQGERQWDYEALLREALCVPEEERLSYYQKAVYVAPQRKEAYLQYLREADRDAVFGQAEEEGLRLLLNSIPRGSSQTYEELLAATPECYGEVASVLGMVYWYDYEGEGGRSIGAGWFQKAVLVAEELGNEVPQPGWAIRSRLFSHMGSYFERIGKEDENSERESSAGAYWEDLGGLLELDMSGYGYPLTLLRFYREALGQITFCTGDLKRAGVTETEMEEMIGEILARAEDTYKETGGDELGWEFLEKIRAQGDTAREMAGHLRDYQEQTEKGG